jgi:glycerol-3-phosphate dehydrogenase
MAVKLADVVFRRTGLGTLGHPGTDCLRTCAAILAEEQGWNAERTQLEIGEVEEAFRRTN